MASPLPDTRKYSSRLKRHYRVIASNISSHPASHEKHHVDIHLDYQFKGQPPPGPPLTSSQLSKQDKPTRLREDRFAFSSPADGWRMKAIDPRFNFAMAPISASASLRRASTLCFFFFFFCGKPGKIRLEGKFIPTEADGDALDERATVGEQRSCLLLFM